jgi:hypothetical protein
MHYTVAQLLLLRNIFEVDIFPILGYYAASSGNTLSTFRDNLLVPSSRINNTKKTWTFINFILGGGGEKRDHLEDLGADGKRILKIDLQEVG